MFPLSQQSSRLRLESYGSQTSSGSVTPGLCSPPSMGKSSSWEKREGLQGSEEVGVGSLHSWVWVNQLESELSGTRE